MTVEIRDATEADAEAACEVMRRSITELCTADHHGDPAVLANWLANKQPEIFRSWLQRGQQSYLVAVEAGRIVCVGGVTDKGHIALNYVLPEARFAGVSAAMLAALEQLARERGIHTCTLESTATARRFYADRGYIETGPPDHAYGTDSGFPMSKSLV